MNGAWFLAYRAHQLAHGELFSYFIQGTQFGAFTPVWSFYGGPMFTLGGALTLIFGGPWRALDLLAIMAWASAYWGMFWIGRLAGASRWFAHVPAICLITSAYWITDAYGRGDWAEFLAISSLPLLAASIVAIMGNTKLRLGPFAAFVWALWVFTGTHNITLLWGVTILVMIGAAFIAFGVRGPIEWRSAGQLMAVAALVVSINAWYIIPDALCASATVIGSDPAAPLAQIVAGFNSPMMLFYPLRKIPKTSTTPALYVQLPSIFLCAAIGCIAAGWKRAHGRQKRSAIALLCVFGVLVVATACALPTSLPKPFSSIQFSYRMVAYVTLVVAAIAVMGVVCVRSMSFRMRRWFGALMVAVCVGACCVAAWQVWMAPKMDLPLMSRTSAVSHPLVAPPSFYGYNDYHFVQGPLITKKIERTYSVSQTSVTHGGMIVKLPLAPQGSLIQTNIGGGSPFVRIWGDVVRIGHNGTGFAVVRVVRHGPSGEVMRLSIDDPALFVPLQVISLVAAGAIAAYGGVLAWKSVWPTAAHRRTGRGRSRRMGGV